MMQLFKGLHLCAKLGNLVELLLRYPCRYSLQLLTYKYLDLAMEK